MLPNLYQILSNNTTVNTIISGRVYRHGSAPQMTEKPFIIWQLTSGSPENTLGNIPDIDSLSIQVDCYHQTDAGVIELATAVRDTLEPLAHMTGIPVDQREDETRLYRMTLEFDWWLYR